MINNKQLVRKILREFVADTNVNEPTTYSRGSVGKDFRNKIFDLPYSNTTLLQFIEDVNDLLILNPLEMTLLSKQLQNKLPDTISMLKDLDITVQKEVMSRFIPKLKLDFFYLYSLVLSRYNQVEPVDNQTEDEPTTEIEPNTDDIENDTQDENYN